MIQDKVCGLEVVTASVYADELLGRVVKATDECRGRIV